MDFEYFQMLFCASDKIIWFLLFVPHVFSLSPSLIGCDSQLSSFVILGKKIYPSDVIFLLMWKVSESISCWVVSDS